MSEELSGDFSSCLLKHSSARETPVQTGRHAERVLTSDHATAGRAALSQ